MPACVGSIASTMFSATVITGISMKCWCTIPTPASIAALGVPRPHGLAADLDLALVRVVEPVEDVHQRRLAGAVLAEQGVDLALAEVEVDVVVRDDPGKALRDVAHLEHGSRRISHRGGILRPSSAACEQTRLERAGERQRAGPTARPLVLLRLRIR